MSDGVRDGPQWSRKLWVITELVRCGGGFDVGSSESCPIFPLHLAHQI